MRIVMTSLAVLALMACSKPAETTNDVAASDENMAMDANAAADANAVTPAGFQIAGTSWEFTRDGQPQTETVGADGNYVNWSGDKHIDHGKAWMEGDKACFDSAMDKEAHTCWSTSPTEVGQTLETTSDKGEKLSVKRIAFLAVPEAVQP